jgi:hypothetical protein
MTLRKSSFAAMLTLCICLSDQALAQTESNTMSANETIIREFIAA